MKPYKPNQGTQKAQEPLDQGDVPSHIGPESSWSPPDAHIWAGVVEAFQGFMRMLAAVLVHASDEGRRHVAKILLPGVRHLLAFLEELRGDRLGEMAESPCGSCSKKDGCKQPCEQLEAHLNGPCEGKLHDETTISMDFDEIRALRGSSEGEAGDEKTRWASSPELARQALAHDEAVYALFINGKGHVARESEVQSIDPADFAVYLDTTRDVLGIRFPGNRPSLRSIQEAGIDGVQDLLGAMIERPHLNFGNVNVRLFLPHRAGMTPDAFRKAMANVRYALQQGERNGPFLLHVERSHYSISESGHAWRISSSAGDLCLVRFLLPSERFRPKRRR